MSGDDHTEDGYQLSQSEKAKALATTFSNGSPIPGQSRLHVATAYIGYRVTGSNSLIYMHADVNILISLIVNGFYLLLLFFLPFFWRVVTFNANKGRHRDFLLCWSTFTPHLLYLFHLPRRSFPISHSHPLPLDVRHGASLLHHCMPAV